MSTSKTATVALLALAALVGAQNPTRTSPTVYESPIPATSVSPDDSSSEDSSPSPSPGSSISVVPPGRRGTGATLNATLRSSSSSSCSDSCGSWMSAATGACIATSTIAGAVGEPVAGALGHAVVSGVVIAGCTVASTAPITGLICGGFCMFSPDQPQEEPQWDIVFSAIKDGRIENEGFYDNLQQQLGRDHAELIRGQKDILNNLYTVTARQTSVIMTKLQSVSTQLKELLRRQFLAGYEPYISKIKDCVQIYSDWLENPAVEYRKQFFTDCAGGVELSNTKLAAGPVARLLEMLGYNGERSLWAELGRDSCSEAMKKYYIGLLAQAITMKAAAIQMSERTEDEKARDLHDLQSATQEAFHQVSNVYDRDCTEQSHWDIQFIVPEELQQWNIQTAQAVFENGEMVTAHPVDLSDGKRTFRVHDVNGRGGNYRPPEYFEIWTDMPPAVDVQHMPANDRGLQLQISYRERDGKTHSPPIVTEFLQHNTFQKAGWRHQKFYTADQPYGYLHNEGENCVLSNMNYIQTREECSRAAAVLDLTDKVADNSGTHDERPQGCYYKHDNQNEKRLYFSTRDGTRGHGVWRDGNTVFRQLCSGRSCYSQGLRSGGATLARTIVGSAEECHNACVLDSSCQFWTWYQQSLGLPGDNHRPQECFLKTEVNSAGLQYYPGAVSGPRACKRTAETCNQMNPTGEKALLFQGFENSAATNARTAETCQEECRSRGDDCLGWALMLNRPASDDQTCWLKRFDLGNNHYPRGTQHEIVAGSQTCLLEESYYYDGVQFSGENLPDNDQAVQALRNENGASSAIQCQEACRQKNECRAWTFYREGSSTHHPHSCWLKRGAGEIRPFRGATSGPKEV